MQNLKLQEGLSSIPDDATEYLPPARASEPAGRFTPLIASEALTSSSSSSLSGSGEGWNGHHHEVDDENYGGPTVDNHSDDGEHAVEDSAVPGGQGHSEEGSDETRRIFDLMMANSEETVWAILRSVPLDQALEVQDKVENYLKFLLSPHGGYGGGGGLKHPERPPQKRRPKTKDPGGKRVRSQKHGNKKVTDASRRAGNPEGRASSSRPAKRFKDSTGLGSGKKKSKKSSSSSVD